MAREIKTVGVVGLGTMGAGIAEVFARHGRTVIGVERDGEMLAAGRQHVERSTAKAVQRGRLAEDERAVLIRRVTFTTDLAELHPCDLVVEAVPEWIDMKIDLFTRLDGIVDAGAILVTNTSSLSVSEIGAATKHPERVAGMHFFNPAPVLKLVEVVRGQATAPEVVDTVDALARDVRKVPVVCGDQAGFIANALLFGYLNQAATMVESGYATPEAIDAAMQNEYGYPMGPLALLDLIGLDTAVQILERMHSQSQRDRHAPAAILHDLVAEGRLGRKSGQGFYGESPQPGRPAAGEPAAAEIADALIRPYLDDAVRMRDIGYAPEGDIDTAMKLGCGLPKGPFEILAGR
ncbi:MAG TPA: 3-hydroxyacyl-CoA dehydrogenase NAD-binding domain-containing protein [Jiangellaceae bacterium]|nr:3-hydroxyacyl-CoA dehydrogenase NAD-binding domain-containing protein [Jiangellaceae bacterium]